MGGIRSLGLAALLSVFVLSPVSFTACCGNLGGELKEGMEKSLAVSAEIKRDYGVEANVQFNISDGKKKISVALSSKPAGDEPEIKAGVEAIVKRHFPDADEIEVKM